MFGKTTVKVDHQALKDYLEDWHENRRGRCKADGAEWPCATYSAVYYAVHGKYPLTRPE